MKRTTITMKRWVAAALAVIMLFTTADFAFADSVAPGSSDGDLVAESYELSEEEKAVMRSDLLVGKKHEFTVPGTEDNLVTVDPVAKTIVADDYTDNGYTWKPVSAQVVYSGGAEDVTLTDGNGIFTYDQNAYTVEVKYQLHIDVDVATQQKLLDAPYQLSQGVNNLDMLLAQESVLAGLEGEKDLLYKAAQPIVVNNMTVSLADATKEAVMKLYNQCADADEKLDLSVLVAAYKEAKNNTLSIKFLMEKGAEIKNVTKDFYETLVVITDNSTGLPDLVNRLEIFESINMPVAGLNSATLKLAVNTLVNLRDALKPVVDDSWSVLEAEVLKSGIMDAEYQALEPVVRGAIGKSELHTGLAQNATLLAAEKVIAANVNQFNVTIKVKANVIPENVVDSDVTSALTEFTKVITLMGGVTKTEVEAAVHDTGIEAAAIASWAGVDKFNVAGYDRVASGLGDTLEADATYVIEYSPKMYTITYVYDGNSTKEVPYGYNIKLPLCATDGESYLYDVSGESLDEGEVYTVKSHITISREQGKSKTGMSLNAVLSEAYNYLAELGAEAAALLKNVALKSETISVRVPTDADNLVSLTDQGATYQVTAQKYYSGIVGVYWTPVSGSVINGGSVVDTFQFGGGTSAEFDKVTFDNVTVNYELDVTDQVDAAAVIAALNLPHELAVDGNKQITAMNRLSSGTAYSGLGELDQTNLNRIAAVKSNFGSESIKAIDDMLALCVDATAGRLYLYNYMTEYRALTGDAQFAWYYTGNNYEKLINQMTLLTGYLNILDADPLFRQTLVDVGYAEYADKIEEIKVELDEIMGNLVEPNKAINRNSTNLTGLVTAIKAAIGKTGAIATASKGVKLVEELTCAAPDKTTIKIVVNQLDSQGGVVSTVNDSYTYANGAITDNHLIELNDILSTLESSINKTYYEKTSTTEFPGVGTTLSGNTTYTFTWAPKEFKLVITAGEDAGLELGAVYCDSTKITLPACPVDGMQYKYVIGGVEIPVGANAGTYNLTTAQFEQLVAGTLSVTREEIDLYYEDLLALVNDLNSSSAAQGLSFILAKDKNDYVIVLRIDNTIKNASLSVIEGIGMTVTGTDFTYIGLDGEDFWADGVVSIQAVINAVLNSGFGTESLIDMIAANGDINEMSLDAKYTIVNSVANENLLGGKVIESVLYFDYTKGQNSNDRPVPFYITFEDYDSMAGELADARSMLVESKNYATFVCENGSVNVTATMPEKAYQAYLTAMLLMNQADLSDVNAIDFAEVLDYDIELVKPLLTDEDVTLVTFQNTLKKLGKDINLSSYEGIYSLVQKLMRNLDANATLEGSSVGNVYTGNINYSIAGLLAKAGLPDNLTGMIAEKDTGLDLPLNLTLTNINTRYEALVIDPSANGMTNKINYSTNAAAAVAAAGENAIVVLLNDVNGDLVIGKQMILDLNGKTITGNVVANATVHIVDSKLDTVTTGTIDGTITGNASITGGKYTGDVSAFLPEGYVQDNAGVVSNSLYTISTDGAGNITVSLTADFMNTVNIPALKSLAVDLAFDVVLNFYTSAAMSIDGNSIYAMQFDDVLGMIDDSMVDLVNAVIDRDLNNGRINYAGITAFVNAVVADLTDFAALQNAVNSNIPVGSYVIETQAWNLKTDVVKNGNYITAVIGADGNKTTRSLSIVIVGSDEEKAKLAGLCGELAKIIASDIELNLNNIHYAGGKNFTIDADGKAIVTVDLAQDDNYAIILGVILANNATGSLRTELIAGIDELLTYGATNSLKAAVNKVTLAQLIAAIKAADEFSAMAANLGLSVSQETVALADLYSEVLNLVAVVLEKLEITGNGATFGGQETADYGVYNVAKQNWKKFTEISLTVNLFRETDPVIDPEIVDVTVSTNAAIAGFYVDGNMIYVDGHYDGITVDQLLASLNFVIRDHDAYRYTYTGTAVGLGGELLVATGFKLTVKATNNTGGEDEETYVVIVMGDTNCDGLNDSGDAVKIRKYFMNHAAMIPGNSELSGYALKAAKINDDTDIDSGDAVKIRSKWLITWDNGAYVSTFAEQFD